MVIFLRTPNCEAKPAVAGGADALPSEVMEASGSNVSSSSSSIFVSTAPSVGMKGGERGKGRGGEGVRKELSRLSLDCVPSSLENSSQRPYSSDIARAFHATAQTFRERATPSTHLGDSSQRPYMSASAQTQRATRSIYGQDTCDSEHANKCICHLCARACKQMHLSYALFSNSSFSSYSSSFSPSSSLCPCFDVAISIHLFGMVCMRRLCLNSCVHRNH